MLTRSDALSRFVKKYHLENIQWLSQDASSRRYARVLRKGKSYILMDSPLSEKPKEFVKIDRWLRRHQLGAPKIFAKNIRQGFLLLEDFGSCPLSLAIKNKKCANDLYILAVDTLINLQKKGRTFHGLPLAYTTMREEHELFLDYYVKHILKKDLSPRAKREFHQLWDRLFKGIQALPKTLVLYDYHVDNLMLKTDNTLGLLDFQDAMVGPIFYDLISLLEDERLPLALTQQKQLQKHYFDLCPELAEEKYARWIAVVAAHRHTRVMGIFARLAIKYKKPQYLQYIQNDLLFLKENLKSPLLNEYAQWIQKYLSAHFWKVPR